MLLFKLKMKEGGDEQNGSGGEPSNEGSTQAETPSQTDSVDSLLGQYGLSKADLSDDGQASKQPSEDENAGDVPKVEDIVNELGQKKPDETQAKAPDQVEKQSKDALDFVNALGLKNGETPFAVESKEKLKELVEKGFDYTRKTQEFAKERENVEKLLDEKITQFENERLEMQELLGNAQKYDYALRRMEAISPDLYNEVMAFSKTVQDEHLNPYTKELTSSVENLKKQNKELEDKLSKVMESVEHKEIRRDWEKDSSAVEAKMSPIAKQLGINIDMKKVQAEWQKSDSTTAEAAFYSVYGPEIQKKYQAKLALDTASKKAAASKTMAGVGGAKTSSAGKSDPDVSKMSEFEYATFLAKNLKI